MGWTEYHLPKKFRWLPTFSRYDKQPFGASVFDDVCQSSIPSGYTVSNETFYQIALKDSVTSSGILAIAENLNFTKVDVDAVLTLADRGNCIVLAASSFARPLCDTLGLTLSRSFFSLPALKRQTSSMFLTHDTLQWVGDSLYSSQSYILYSQLCTAFFLDADSANAVWAYNVSMRKEFLNKRNKAAKDSLAANRMVEKQKRRMNSEALGAVVLSRKIGKGQIILVSTPLLFTNYGMLDKKNGMLIFRILSAAKGKSFLRTEAYSMNARRAESPFRFLLSHTPLRWALYLTMIVLLTFTVFTARRRQKVIPLIMPPSNKALDFVKLIGTLYFQKKNHADLVRKKFILFADSLRRKVQIDVENDFDDAELSFKLARKLGLDEKDILKLLLRIRPIMADLKTSVSEEQMKDLVDEMDRIRDNLSDV